METISEIHINSFNFLLGEGIKRMVKYFEDAEFNLDPLGTIKLSLKYFEIGQPRLKGQSGTKVWPHECRRSGSTYSCPAHAHVRVWINGEPQGNVEVFVGDLPLMVLSSHCTLSKIPRENFPKHKEEEGELGGYFIMNGRERLIRLTIMPRRNYPIAVVRKSFKKRGNGYTEFAIALRSVREDEFMSNIILHWLTNEEPVVCITVGRQQFAVPFSIIIRAMVGKTELEIFEDVRRGSGDSLSLEEAAMRSIMRLSDPCFSSQARALQYLGTCFRTRINANASITDRRCGEIFIENYVAIHLSSVEAKYHLMCFMFRKLHAMVNGRCCPESNDNIMFQEVLLPSTLYLTILRDRLSLLFLNVKETIRALSRKSSITLSMAIVQNALLKRGPEVGQGLRYFLATGSIPGRTYFPLASMLSGQKAGLAVPADNINFLRLAAQFRSVHRGATFNDSRTTDVRKLLGEAYGFICPVHTPDGAPCGLLNHLSAPTKAICHVPSDIEVERISTWLRDHWVRPVEFSRHLASQSERHTVLPVMLDGRLVGWCPDYRQAQLLAQELRRMKVERTLAELIPATMEICLVPATESGSQYCGLYLFTGGSRLVRPVYNLRRTEGEVEKADIEWIGTFEQPYLDVPVTKKELAEREPEDRLHMEISPETLFSVVASLTPYPDFNQSPRNMYQCQMVKQSMGHGSYSWRFRSDAKMYRLLSVQSPLVRTKNYAAYNIDRYPVGFNAVVAVMAYTGYDMEDAMIINKSSYERGFGDACIYKSELIDLSALSSGVGRRRDENSSEYFIGLPDGSRHVTGLDHDGLPFPGTLLRPSAGDALYAYTHIETKVVNVVRYEGLEPAYVEAVSLTGCWFKATITLRLNRHPDIGDKYSSRHGQKGVNSLMVPLADMPWSVQTGMPPDIIFNPHGFPTRMTMGMMIEFLAGKSAALYGKRVDATPFQWSEDAPPFHDYAKDLVDAGFNYWGTETLISGSTGRQIEAQIFKGLVYYQRLRHMVADKYQVRSTGKFDPILRQPNKGRKKQGGMRLGEMERDCLLSHGLVFSLHDRFVESNCDKVRAVVCTRCKSIVHSETRKVDQRDTPGGKPTSFDTSLYRCLFCQTLSVTEKNEEDASNPDPDILISDDLPVASLEALTPLRVIEITAAFRYLIYELALMNIRTVVDFDSFR